MEKETVIEILRTASVGVLLCKEKYYIQVIIAEPNHYYNIEVSQTHALNVSAQSQIGITAVNELPTGMTFEFPVNSNGETFITDERRLDMLVGALEGGSNYWYFFGDKANAIFKKYHRNFLPLADIMMAAIKNGESIPVHDYEDYDRANGDEENTDPIGYINLMSMDKGERLMLKQQPSHFADIIGERDDATTADVWFQFCTLGEVVYG